jgi:hypothetical protein
MSKDITRNYRGYEIVKVANGLAGCPGNQWTGSAYYYETYKDGNFAGRFGTLKTAKMSIDNRLDETDADRAKIARLRASLLGKP